MCKAESRVSRLIALPKQPSTRSPDQYQYFSERFCLASFRWVGVMESWNPSVPLSHQVVGFPLLDFQFKSRDRVGAIDPT